MNDYVVLKLITDELVIAKLLNETRNGVVLLNPVKVVTTYIQKDGHTVLQTSTAPYCRLTTEREFTFAATNLLFIKPLHPELIPFYDQLVKAFEEDESEESPIHDGSTVDEDELNEDVIKASRHFGKIH